MSVHVCVCVFATAYLQVPLPGVLHVLHGAAVDLLQTLLSPLVLRLQLVQLHPQVLPLLAELVLQLLQRRLRLRQLHLQTLLQQGDLERNRQNNKCWSGRETLAGTAEQAPVSKPLHTYTYIKPVDGAGRARSIKKFRLSVWSSIFMQQNNREGQRGGNQLGLNKCCHIGMFVIL